MSIRKKLFVIHALPVSGAAGKFLGRATYGLNAAGHRVPGSCSARMGRL